MNIQTILQFIILLVTRLGVNAIPADVMLMGGSSAATAMILFYLENIISILLAAVRVRILAPAGDQAYADRGMETVTTITHNHSERHYVLRNRGVLIREYLLIELFVSFVVGFFIFTFLFLIQHSTVSGSVIQSTMVWIIGLQLFHFVSDLFLMGRLNSAQAESVLEQSGKRVLFIFLATFIGVFAAMRDITWFAVPFIVLKTLTDVTSNIQSFRTYLRIR
jgi:hypothetical protein